MFRKIRVWVVLLASVLAFFPLFYFLDDSDALDVIAVFCATVAVAVEIYYGPAFLKILRKEAGQMTENYQFLLLGILLVALSTAGTRAYGLWWRMWGKELGYLPEGIVPAFLAWLAFVGYMNHIIAPRVSPEGVPLGNKGRVLVVLAVATVIGLWFAVNN